jgi:hypothetical protein
VPIPTTFTDTCRTRVLATAEHTAFVAAGALPEPITRATRDAQYSALYAGSDPLAHRLRRAIRGVVNAEADTYSAGTAQTITTAERESVYATLVGEYAPARSRPVPAADELSAFLEAAQEDQQ